MAVPTLSASTMYRGALTMLNMASVPMSAAMSAVTDSAITSWSITRTSGTDGHFTTPTDGTSPVPTQAGVDAALAGGPYVFDVKATNTTGESLAAVLTINIRASTYSTSKRSELATINPGTDTNAARINGRTLEFARWATDLGLGNTATPIYFNRWRCSGANRCVVKHEDPTDPCDLGRTNIRLPRNIDFDSLRVNSFERTSPTDSGDKAWYLYGTGPSAMALSTESVRWLDTYDSPGVDGILAVSGLPDVTKTVTGIQIQVPAAGLATGVEFNNWESYGTQSGVSYITDPDSTLEVTWNGRTVHRYFCNNGATVNDTLLGASSVHYDFLVHMSFVRDPNQPGLHLDGIQVQNGQDINDWTIDKWYFIQADGEAGSTKGLWNRDSGGVWSKVGMTIGNMILLTRADRGVVVSGTDADHVFSMANFTHLRQASGVYGLFYQLPTQQIDDTPPKNFPELDLREDTNPAYATCVRGIVHGSINNPNGVSLTTVESLNDEADISAWFPNAAWICNDTIQGLTEANAGVVAYSGVDDTRWDGTVDEVLAVVETACTPALGGSAMLPDGRYKGAKFPDGSDNDGTVYVASAPTTYTLQALAESPLGDAIVLTTTLDQPATAITTITLAPSGVAGVTSGNPIVIAIGEISGSATFTPSALGTLTTSSTNNRSLTDPAAAVTQVIAAPNYITQGVDDPTVIVGATVEITYQLDADATQIVTITPTKAVLTGSYSAATVAIPVGQRSVSVNLTLTAAATGTVNCTNNRSLDNPTDITIRVRERALGAALKMRLRK